jgi:hypothetical protein
VIGRRIIDPCLRAALRLVSRELGLDSFPPAVPSETPRLHVHHDCIVMPSGSALYARSGQPIPGCFLERGPRGQPELPHGKLECLGPDVLCGSMEEWPEVVFLPLGDLSHFGHLLTEGAGWLWPWLASDAEACRWTRAGAVVLVVAPGSHHDSTSIAAQLLCLPQGQVRCTASLAAPILCRRAIVPVPSMINRRSVAAHHFAAVRAVVDRRFGITGDLAQSALSAACEGTGADKVYVSRAALPHGARRIQGEEFLEEILRDRGWSIVHPERLPMGEQLLTIARARMIAGEVSSAFHLLMYFGRELARKTVALLGVRSPARDPRVINYVAQLRQQPVDMTYVACLRFRSRAGAAGVAPMPKGPCDRDFIIPPRVVAQQLDWIADRAPSA